MTLLLIVSLSYSAGLGAINTDKLLAFYYEQVQTPSIDMEILAFTAGGQLIGKDVLNSWRTDVARKYKDAVIVVCHGDDRDGQWVFVPQHVVGPFTYWGEPIPVKEGIRLLRQKYGMRRLVLLTCNPGHYRLSWLDGPVTYAVDNVWVEPDRHDERSRQYPEVVGNVSDFIE